LSRPCCASRGAIVAFANKECVIAAGEVFRLRGQGFARHPDTRPIPITTPLFNCYSRKVPAIEKVNVDGPPADLSDLAASADSSSHAEHAVAHPNWEHGRENPVDSATL